MNVDSWGWEVRSGEKEITRRHGEAVGELWFSPNLQVERISYEGGRLVIQVDQIFRVEEQPEGMFAVVCRDEEVPTPPEKLGPLTLRL